MLHAHIRNGIDERADYNSEWNPFLVMLKYLPMITPYACCPGFRFAASGLQVDMRGGKGLPPYGCREVGT